MDRDNPADTNAEISWKALAEERGKRILELERELSIIQTGHSWRMTAPFRRSRRRLQDALLVARAWLRVLAQRARQSRLRRPLGRVARAGFRRLSPPAQLRVRRLVRRPIGVSQAATAIPGVIAASAYGEGWRVGHSVPQVPLRIGQPLVSVVIPCFNYGQFVREAAESVLRQTLSAVEIIIVDDGSTDPLTRSVLDSLHLPRTTILRRPNGGLSAARNQGIRVARGRYICCLDADDRLAPTYLEKCAALLEADAGLGLVYSWVQLFGDESDVWRTEPFDLAELRHRNFVSVGAVFRKSDWEKVGGYSTTMRQGYEDWEFWLRLGLARVRGTLIPEPLFEHRLHGRTMIHRAQALHENLLADLQARLPDLYRDDTATDQARRAYEIVPVEEPLINMEQTQARPDHQAILALVPWLPAGGGEAVLHSVVSGLREAGASVTIVTSEPSGNEWHYRFAALTDQIYHLPTSVPRTAWREFVHYLVRTRHPSCVLVSGARFGYEVLPDLKTAYPHLRTAEILHNASAIGHIASSIEFDEAIDVHVAVSRVIAAALRERGIGSHKIHVIANGVNTRHLDPSRFDRRHVRREWQLPPDRPVVTYIGRLNEEKNPLEFLDLAENLSDTRAHFLVVGDGALHEAFEARLSRPALAGRVRWLRNVPPDDIPSVLAASDVLAITSKSEGLPIVMLEALAMNVPVFTYDVGDVRAAIRNGENGYVFAPSDLVALTRALRDFLITPAHREALQRAARASLISAGFSLGDLQRAYNALLLQGSAEPEAVAR